MNISKIKDYFEKIIVRLNETKFDEDKGITIYLKRDELTLHITEYENYDPNEEDATKYAVILLWSDNSLTSGISFNEFDILIDFLINTFENKNIKKL